MVDVVFCFALLHSHVKPAAGKDIKDSPLDYKEHSEQWALQARKPIRDLTKRGSPFCSLTEILPSPWPTVQPQSLQVLCCTSCGSGAPASSAGLSPSVTHCSHHQPHHSFSLLTARPLLQPGPQRPAARQRYGKVVTSWTRATENIGLTSERISFSPLQTNFRVMESMISHFLSPDYKKKKLKSRNNSQFTVDTKSESPVQQKTIHWADLGLSSEFALRPQKFVLLSTLISCQSRVQQTERWSKFQA